MANLQDETELQRLLDATEDFDERKRIRAQLMEVKNANREKRREMLEKRENSRENHIQKRQAEAKKHKEQLLAMYDQMAKSAPAGAAKSMDVGIYKDGSSGETIVSTKQNKVEDVIQQTKREADERKKRLLAAYDFAAKTQPSGTIKVVNFDAFKKADVSNFDQDTKHDPTFCAAGGIPKVNKNTGSITVTPSGSIDAEFAAGQEAPHLDYMQRMIKQRQEEAADNKRRILQAYAVAAKQGGPKSVMLQEYRDLVPAKAL